MHLAPAAWPIPLTPVTLEGRIVRLEPLVTTPHTDPPADLVDALARAADDPSIWRYLASDGQSVDGMRAYIEDLAAQWERGTALPFAIRLLAGGHPESGRLVGVTRLKDAVRAHRRFGVGSWLTPSVWGRGANVEAKALLLSHAFDVLGAIRLELETDVRNTRSRAALAALGAVEEGVLRSQRITRDGGRRDTVMFSIIDADWPSVRTRISARLAAR
jgi:N-acetyltransferase